MRLSQADCTLQSVTGHATERVWIALSIVSIKLMNFLAVWLDTPDDVRVTIDKLRLPKTLILVS